MTRAYQGADWRSLSASRDDDFLVFPAAGNDRDKPGTQIYHGLGAAVFESEMTVATLLPSVQFALDWDADSDFSGFPSLAPSDAEVQALLQSEHALGVDALGPPGNVLIVGSTTPGRTFDELVVSAFSNGFSDVYPGPDLFAVGEQIFTFGGFKAGTSVAAPQVAGLASYLWLLSPDLRSRPVSATREAILANVRGVGVIDAYASALSLDAAALPTAANAPVRLATLDVDDDHDFDAFDLVEFIEKFIDPQTGQPFEPTEPDYSRFDLNGDGFTGGSAGERFDLDRAGSMQYGTSQYSFVTQQIEGGPRSFDETHLTDFEILCYYAYSALYAQDEQNTQLRTELFKTTPGCMAPVVLEAVFPTSIVPGTDTLLVVRVLNEFSDGTRQPIPGVRIELDPSGGTVDDFAGVTDQEGFFQTRARLFAGSTQIAIDITIRSQAGGPVLAEKTVRASTGLTFTFDDDLQGWSTGVVVAANFNHVTHDHKNGSGVVLLDGSDGEPRGAPDGQPNSWIFKTIQIPSGATTLEFDTAPHNRPESDSALRVRLVAFFVSHTLLDWEVLKNPKLCTEEDCTPVDHLDFVHRSADISAFAGQSVTLFFEQGDNGPGSNEQRYIDNISIH